VWLYANGAGEQTILKVREEASFDAPLAVEWSRRVAGAAEYSSFVRDVGGDALVGLEWGSGLQAGSSVAFFSSSGKMRWWLPVTDPSEGGLLYAHAASVAPGPGVKSRIVVATDTGKILVFSENSESPTKKPLRTQGF
jgi:hypothetical protein